MSEPEFEMYLSLMSKFLRLTSAQKADIAEELRIHLEDRLAELTAQGKSRAEAIRLALEEFGDAGALAWQFTLPHHIRRRRLIMRYSLGSFVAVAGVFTLVSLMWPPRPDHPPMMAQATAQTGPDQSLPAFGSVLSEKSELRRQVEAKLEKLIDKEIKISKGADHSVAGSGIDFLKSSLQEIQKVIDVDILIDQFNESPQAEYVISARAGTMTGKTLLELVLRQAGVPNLTYVIKDGVILITDSDADYEVQVYDCRDLIAGVSAERLPQAVGGGMMGGMGAGGLGGMGGGGYFSVPAELASAVIGQFGGRIVPANQDDGDGESSQTNPAGGGLGGLGRGRPPLLPGSGQLMMVILKATQPAQWQDLDGCGGTISTFDGMLVVRHNQAVHRKIEDVLEKLRLAKRTQQQALDKKQAALPSLVIPPGMRLVTLNTNGWQVPMNAIKSGSRVDILVSHNNQWEIAYSDMEVIWPDATPLMMGFGVPTSLQVNSLSLIVSPEQALELKNDETSHGMQFLLCGDKAAPDQKAVPQQPGAGLAIPSGKRLVTMIPESWQLPLGTLKVGSKVDLFEMVSEDGGYKPRIAFPSLEVAAFSARRIDRDSPPVGESTENVWINTISFVVEPDLAAQLKEFQVRVSYSSINGGATQFVLRGEGDHPGVSATEPPLTPIAARALALE